PHPDLPSFPTRRSSDLLLLFRLRPKGRSDPGDSLRDRGHAAGSNSLRRFSAFAKLNSSTNVSGLSESPIRAVAGLPYASASRPRSEEHTSELQSRSGHV